MTNDTPTRSTHSELLDVSVEYGAAIRHREALYRELTEITDRFDAIQREVARASVRVNDALRKLEGFFLCKG
jgi:hypothetical protein